VVIGFFGGVALDLSGIFNPIHEYGHIYYAGGGHIIDWSHAVVAHATELAYLGGWRFEMYTGLAMAIVGWAVSLEGPHRVAPWLLAVGWGYCNSCYLRAQASVDFLVYAPQYGIPSAHIIMAWQHWALPIVVIGWLVVLVDFEWRESGASTAPSPSDSSDDSKI